ncbi:Protein of unknown function [Pyronema omphalodes CBS 100304]|uniref:Uncharacterized protein n=1 Tax=Pyronema omphalodes (strain CBS 100304) TaxID=1076935 RepID=U4KXR3_PYROM|nr:Protein of unknown function [Pyronema omphalodes CBS 100304]
MRRSLSDENNHLSSVGLVVFESSMKHDEGARTQHETGSEIGRLGWVQSEQWYRYRYRYRYSLVE